LLIGHLTDGSRAIETTGCRERPGRYYTTLAGGKGCGSTRRLSSVMPDRPAQSLMRG
jgi:hypothetical protein